MDRQEPFDYELVCAHCGEDLGSFLQGEAFAEEPHTCPHCQSRHLTHGPATAGAGTGRWATLLPGETQEEEEKKKARHVRYLVPR